MAATLKTNFVGIQMPNPFMLASAPPTTSAENIARSFERGWGGAVIKTVQYSPRWIKPNVSPRIHAVKDRNQIIGFTNFEIGSQKTLEEWAKGIAWLKQRFPEHGVLASLMHTDVLKEEEWRETTRILDDAGADGFELNLSCSHGQAESGCGAMLGVDEEKIKMVVSWVREETTKPVMPKLTALTMNVQGKGLAAKAGGASAITAINTMNSLPGIDLDRFVPYNMVDGMSAPQGLSGKAIKPIALGCVMRLALATGLPISATGGVYTWRDAAEFISLGAQTIQVCSAVMENGYGIIDQLTGGLLDYMERMHFASIDSFRGKALAHITRQIDLSREHKVVASVDASRCIGCEKCIHSCRDSGYEALRLEGKTAVCDRTQCDGCGLCAQVCPRECISFIKK
ncbi:NAD-dependent dihydropyrimidine dehydrogenase subunit PreA|uniref:dihydrouracil dehydrogenase (NAD(+)) n=1 Tax=Dendrosporobacter quercicolus TaxID=146817 RepID=A0A1G9RW20_9FIRM|nr:NAD-dependent dihydropyrimidine dehydrogenase subunit PreA [Dendrosporobacter quercicolus]NSL49325.1 NAD-dependent dihydropyrimidine dehydrogenase subunit PreA [Dendrosporobacter quercicolus DSM 1736]SDM27436.1 dihydropyrimidine dehydrogenase (NAD+) subunit PreA [Dendrosporobacter quercicolus]